MLVIQDILVSEDLLENHFACNLSACKGACCWEGDWGAPLGDEEIELLTSHRETLRPFLTEEGNQVIDEEGSAVFYKEPQKNGTPLVNNRECAYLTFDSTGIGRCGIERANESKAVHFSKPISCHLYPIRYEEDGELGFKALNYDRWEICNAACNLGDQLKLPLYQFVKNALVRKFGKAFYEELHGVAEDLADRDSRQPA